MKFFRVFIPAGIGLLTLAGCEQAADDAAVSSSPSSSYADGQAATVTSVESANTVTVDIDGVQRQVRLLNVVAPSDNNNVLSGSCLVEESTDYLRQKLPEGTPVTLRFDDSLVGSSGYLDAALYSGDSFVNAEVMRAGMATTTFSTPEDRFYGEVSRAQQQAAEQRVGLYSQDTDCTIPHRIKTATEQARDASRIADENERAIAYQEASAIYNSLNSEADEPSRWVGSIITLDAVSQQLDTLKETLGENYRDENGLTPQDHASASVLMTRPADQP